MAPDMLRSLTRRRVLQVALGASAVAVVGVLEACQPAAPAAPTRAPAAPAATTPPAQAAATAKPAAAVPPAAPTAAAPAPTSPPPPTVQPAVATTLNYWDSAPDPLREASWKATFASFEKTHPNVTGQYVPVAPATYLPKLTTAIGGGKAPDAADMQGGWLAQFASMGALLDLQPYYDAWPLKNDLLPAYQRLARAYNDKMFWLPRGAFMLGILYRPDWVAEAGVKAPIDHYKDGTWTWQAFLDTATALNKPDQNRFGFALRGGFGAERNLFNVIMTYTGGKWFDAESNCLIGSDPAIEAVDWYADLFRTAKLAPSSAPNDGYPQMQANFSSGVAGMYMHSQDGLGAQRTALGFDKVAAAPLPAGPTGSWQQLDGLGSSAFQQAKNPQLAAELVFASLSPAAFDALIQADVQAGKKPFTTTVDMPFKSLFDRKEYKDDPYYWAFMEVAQKTDHVYVNPIYLPEYTALVNTIVIPDFQKVLLGQTSSKEACTRWAAEFTKAQKAFVERQKVG